jgi:hypothetical protein
MPLHMLLNRYTGRLTSWFRISGGGLKRPVIEKGRRVDKEGGGKSELKAPGVYIKTEVRRGHNVTVMRGLEILRIMLTYADVC